MEDEDKCENSCTQRQGRRPERPTISHQRRVELSHLAVEMSDHMINKVKPHEMNLLWRMIQNLINVNEHLFD